MSFLTHSMQPCDPYRPSPEFEQQQRRSQPISNLSIFPSPYGYKPFVSNTTYSSNSTTPTHPTSKTSDGYLGHRQNFDGSPTSAHWKFAKESTQQTPLIFNTKKVPKDVFYLGGKQNLDVPRKKGKIASPPGSLFPYLSSSRPKGRIMHFTDHVD